MRQRPEAGFRDEVARLVRALDDADALAAVAQHFGHERHAFVPAVRIERAQDFVGAAHLDQFASGESGGVVEYHEEAGAWPVSTVAWGVIARWRQRPTVLRSWRTFHTPSAVA